MNINICDWCRDEVDLAKSIRCRVNTRVAGREAQFTYAFCSPRCAGDKLAELGKSLKLPKAAVEKEQP